MFKIYPMTYSNRKDLDECIKFIMKSLLLDHDTATYPRIMKETEMSNTGDLEASSMIREIRPE